MVHHLRYALRALAARPGFTAVAVLTLALGIGANTAIFTVVHAVLLRALPLPGSDRLVVLIEHSGSLSLVTTSWQNYVDWRQQSRSYDGFGAVRSATMTLVGRSDPERVPVKMLTASLFSALGTAPALGRGIDADDDRPGAPGVAVLSDALWRRRFGAAPDAVGRAATLDGQLYTIVGVMPPAFDVLAHADVFLPMGPWAATLPDDRGWHPGLFAIGRLKRDVTVERAQAEMDVISARLERQYPTTNHSVTAEVKPLHDYAVQNVRQSLVVLAAAVGFVLLIACANVANLLLARAVGRRKEIAVRTALGASRPRIVAELLVESVVLALAGGAAGLLLALWSVRPLAALAIASAPGATAAPIAVDAAALAFTLGIAVATGLLFGLAPALRITRVDVSAAMSDGGRSAAAGAGHHVTRGVLVGAEIALATILLVGAALLTRSLLHLQRVDAGIDPRGVLLADTPLSPTTYATTPQRNRLVDALLAELRAQPGVAQAEAATSPPFFGPGTLIHFNIAGRPPKGPAEFTITGFRAVTAGYFAALGVPLVDGRFFDERDRDQSPAVAIVNDTFVRRFFRGDRRAALAARTQLGALPDEEPLMRIVGIVGDTKQAFDAEAQPTMFVPYQQPSIALLGGMYRNLTLVLKTSGDPAMLAGGVRAALHEMDADQPLARMRSMEDAMADSVVQPRLRTTLLAAFTGVALALSIVGVYGMMAYAVSERRHEIGVRIALGAAPADIRSLVVGQGARVAAAGVACGVVGALATARALNALLFGVRATDPAAFVLSAVVLGAAATAAAWIPARRAERIDPVELLR